jgi:hypothetical protein
MIKISSTLQSILQSPPIEFCHAVVVYNYSNNTNKTFTDNPFNFTLSNGIEYVADGTLLMVDPLKISTNVDREEISFSIADPNFQQASFLESSIVGKKIEIRLVFYDNGDLVTNTEDTLHYYSGYGNGVGYVIKTEERGEVYAKISCTSPMSDLDHKKGIYLNKEFMRNQNSRDSSCDSIYAGSGSLQLKWGKR